MNVLELAQKLISIPSFVDSTCNEADLANYISEYIKANTSLQLTIQRVAGERANIIAYSQSCLQIDGSFDVDILFINHIDTVLPKSGWGFDQFKGKVKENKLYGLGANDTKGNVAALLKAAETVTDQRVMFLFYIDEEYDFAGMQRFIQDYTEKLKVKRIVSADGEGLRIRTACRGLVEIDLAVLGTSGHSANPSGGNNAIVGLFKIYQRLNWQLSRLEDEDLGSPSLNLAFVNAGLKQGESIVRSGNSIPDYAEGTIECRTNKLCNKELIWAILEGAAKEYGLNIKLLNTRHDYDAWQSDLFEDLVKVLEELSISVEQTSPGNSGYVDIAMLTNALSCPGCTIGAIGGNSHGVGEWVNIPSLFALETIFTKLIDKYKSAY